MERVAPLYSRGHNAWPWPGSRRGGRQFFAEAQMPESGKLDQRPPHNVHQMMPDQEPPEPVGTLVEVRHCQIRRDGAPVVRTAAPDRNVGKQTAIEPGVA